MKEVTKIISSLSPNQVRAFDSEKYRDAGLSLGDYEKLGVRIPPAALKTIESNKDIMAMDAAPLPQTGGGVPVPIWFLTHFLNTPVKVVTRARVADDLVGREIAGRFADAQIVQPIVELLGQPRPYTDKSSIPLSDYNYTFEGRNIVRFEQGVEVGIIEAERGSAMRLNVMETKRTAATEALAISLNRVFFYGFNDGEGRTYGLLNDPNAPTYTAVATGAGTGTPTEWESKTAVEIVNDIITAANDLRVKSGYNYDPFRDAATLAIAGDAVDWLAKTSEQYLGLSVRDWIAKTYPKMRIVPVPELSDADGGENVFYLFADRIGNQKVIGQYVQDVLRMLGMERRIKYVLEDYASATAGAMILQPIGVVAYSGI